MTSDTTDIQNVANFKEPIKFNGSITAFLYEAKVCFSKKKNIEDY